MVVMKAILFLISFERGVLFPLPTILVSMKAGKSALFRT